MRYTGGAFLSKNRDLIKTSINLPSKIYKGIEAFADSVCINRNSAMIYLLARGLEYEIDFERYMQRKRKKKLNPEYVQNGVENSIQKRMNDKAKQRLEHDENRAIYSAIAYDENLRNMILEYTRKMTKEDSDKLIADANERYKKENKDAYQCYPPPNIGSLDVDANNYLFDITNELDTLIGSFKVIKYSCSTIDVYVEKDTYLDFCLSLEKSLDVLINYMNVLVTELYRMCDYQGRTRRHKAGFCARVRKSGLPACSLTVTHFLMQKGGEILEHDKHCIFKINSDIDEVELFLLDLYLYELDKVIGKLEKLVELLDIQ